MRIAAERVNNARAEVEDGEKGTEPEVRPAKGSKRRQAGVGQHKVALAEPIEEHGDPEQWSRVALGARLTRAPDMARWRRLRWRRVERDAAVADVREARTECVAAADDVHGEVDRAMDSLGKPCASRFERRVRLPSQLRLTLRSQAHQLCAHPRARYGEAAK